MYPSVFFRHDRKDSVVNTDTTDSSQTLKGLYMRFLKSFFLI